MESPKRHDLTFCDLSWCTRRKQYPLSLLLPLASFSTTGGVVVVDECVFRCGGERVDIGGARIYGEKGVPRLSRGIMPTGSGAPFFLK